MLRGTISTLQFVRSSRAGRGGATERRYRDLVVDGVALSTLFEGDLIPPFGWSSEEDQASAVERLLRQATPDLPGNRVSLFVCPECGEFACGVIGVVVEATPEGILWRDFALQYADGGEVREVAFENIGPFLFDADAYGAFFASLLQGSAFAADPSNPASADNPRESS